MCINDSKFLDRSEAIPEVRTLAAAPPKIVEAERLGGLPSKLVLLSSDGSDAA